MLSERARKRQALAAIPARQRVAFATLYRRKFMSHYSPHFGTYLDLDHFKREVLLDPVMQAQHAKGHLAVMGFRDMLSGEWDLKSVATAFRGLCPRKHHHRVREAEGRIYVHGFVYKLGDPPDPPNPAA